MATTAKTTKTTQATGTHKASKPRKPAAKKPAAASDRTATMIAFAGATMTVLFSMVLNVWGFTHGEKVTGWWTILGGSLGIALPLWVLATTYIGQHMHSRDTRLSIGAYILAGFTLLVSMPHLANGYMALGMVQYEAWALAVVTDLTQIVMKMAIIRMSK